MYILGEITKLGQFEVMYNSWGKIPDIIVILRQ